jgi:hypothetical protein
LIHATKIEYNLPDSVALLNNILSSLRSVSLARAANIVNWIGFTPIIVAALLERFLGVEGAITHWLPLLSLAFAGFAYAFFLSIDSSFELFRDRALFDGVPRWLWRWVCAGFAFGMLAVIFFIYVSPLW